VLYQDKPIGIGKEGRTAHGTGPLGCRVGGGHELRLNVGGCTPGGLVEGGQISLNGAMSIGTMVLRSPCITWDGALLVGVGRNQTGIHGKAFPPEPPLDKAALDHRLEQVTQDIALAEASMVVAREGGVVRHLAVKT